MCMTTHDTQVRTYRLGARRGGSNDRSAKLQQCLQVLRCLARIFINQEEEDEEEDEEEEGEEDAVYRWSRSVVMHPPVHPSIHSLMCSLVLFSFIHSFIHFFFSCPRLCPLPHLCCHLFVIRLAPVFSCVRFIVKIDAAVEPVDWMIDGWW
eukprot:GHVU01154490.1.p1 GENE.GHVU01154490.1~~GHVU01154490.1.p1  ORF type:complete len:151 (-),score=15.18 GHVU01154490.1:121-573(-)